MSEIWVGRCADDLVFPEVLELTEHELELSARMAKVAASYMAAVGRYTIYRPFRGDFRVTQKYHSGHKGTDWGTPNDTGLFPMFPANEITFAGYTPDGYAYNIRGVDTTQGLMFLLAHMPAKGAFLKNVGDKVTYADQIGYSDNTGNSTGPHVHVEVRLPPYTYYSNAFDFYDDLDELPSTPPPGEELPEFPELPIYRVLAKPSLYIRKSPGVSYGLFGANPLRICFVARLFMRIGKLVGGKASGSIPFGVEVRAMGASYLGSDLWLQIGHEQHIAGKYRGVVLAERIDAK